MAFFFIYMYIHRYHTCKYRVYEYIYTQKIMKDAALFLRDNEELFVAQTKEVVIMGGIQMPACRPAPEEL